MLKESTISQAYFISMYAQEYCLKYKKKDVKPGELMPYLVKQKVYSKVDDREGQPIRKVLREVSKAGRLKELIPQARGDEKDENTMWFFNVVGK